METNKSRRFMRVEIGDDVKKLTIEGKNKDEQVVMREELSEEDLDAVIGGVDLSKSQNCKNLKEELQNSVSTGPVTAWWFF